MHKGVKCDSKHKLRKLTLDNEVFCRKQTDIHKGLS